MNIALTRLRVTINNIIAMTNFEIEIPKKTVELKDLF